jgi:hypothetical protein
VLQKLRIRASYQFIRIPFSRDGTNRRLDEGLALVPIGGVVDSARVYDAHGDSDRDQSADSPTSPGSHQPSSVRRTLR